MLESELFERRAPMKRSSSLGSQVSADALLEAGRTRSELQYDIDARLARHHQWLQTGAPLPAWANAPGVVGSASLVSVVAKVLLVSVVVGAHGFVSWHEPSSFCAPRAAPAASFAPSTKPTSAVASTAGLTVPAPSASAASHAALQASPARALALARASEQRFPDGYFRQERAHIEIMALLGLGDRDAARAQAARFFSRYPEVPYGARIRQALQELH